MTVTITIWLSNIYSVIFLSFYKKDLTFKKSHRIFASTKEQRNSQTREPHEAGKIPALTYREGNSAHL
jgi:hypothetical protein